MESLLEELIVYRALSTRVEAGDEEASRLSETGGLVEAFEALGEAPLIRAMESNSSVDAIVLEDGSLSVSLRRRSGRAVLEVEWSSGER